MANDTQPPETPATSNYLYEERNRPCFLWTLILAPCLMPLVWDYFITITTMELQFGFSASCMQKHVNRTDIISCEAIEHINGICEWGGYGIRKQLPTWDTGYIARNGPGVKIIVKPPNSTKELHYTFSCHEPNQVVSILNQR